MKTNRRGFLFGTPLAAFALAQFDEEAFSQTSNAGAPPDVVISGSETWGFQPT